MKSKLMLLAGVGVGYVLGAKAGRSRYEEIRGRAQQLWHDPRVEEKKEQVATMAKERGEQLKETAVHAVKDRTSGGSADDLSQVDDADLQPSTRTTAGKEQVDSPTSQVRPVDQPGA